MKGYESKQSEKRPGDEIDNKSDQSEYAVLIPEHMEIEGPVIEAEVRVHHRSTSQTFINGVTIEGKKRSITPLDDTRNN